jgi:iron complex outermembrane receptor protein
LSLTAGVRYSWEHRSTSEQEYLPDLGGNIFLAAQGMNTPQTTFTSLIPRASIRYKLTDQTNVYFSYSQGFKSGGISQSNMYWTPAGAAFLTSVGVATSPGSPAQVGGTYKPETISAYEIGIKSSPTRRLTIDAAAFYYDYTNLQVQVDEGFTAGQIENAATARIYGLDADLTARLTDEFTLGAQLALTSAHYVCYGCPGSPKASILVPIFANGLPDGNGVANVNASGKELPRAPDVTASVNADYKKVFSAGTFDINGNLYYSGRVYFDSYQRISQAPYTTLAMQASWQPAGTNFVFEVWGKNITNTTYLISMYEDTQSDGAGYAPPATYGVAVKYSF